MEYCVSVCVMIMNELKETLIRIRNIICMLFGRYSFMILDYNGNDK